MFGFGDKELKKAKLKYEGKFVAEHQKTQTKYHEIVWVGRSKHEDYGTGLFHIRMGIKWQGKDKVTWTDIDDYDRFFQYPTSITSRPS